MRKLIVAEYVTLDGVMEAPGEEPGHPYGGWTRGFDDPARERFELEETLAADTLVLGSTTYDQFAEFWPEQEGPLADKINAMPKLVASKTRVEVGWHNSELIQGEVHEAIAREKHRDGGPLMVAGSRTLVHTLMRHDLVDEFHLVIFPVVLGSGMRLFPDTRNSAGPQALELADTRVFDAGVVIHTYRPNGHSPNGHALNGR